MNPAHFQHPGWYHALTLSERIRSLPAFGWRSAAEGNIALAQQRLHRWQSQAPFTDPHLFAQRLALDGVTETAFLSLLGEPVESLPERFPAQPPWLAELARAFLHSDHLSPPFPEETAPEDLSGFLVIAWPLIEQGRSRVRRELLALMHKQSDLPIDAGMLEKSLLANLSGLLLPMLTRTLVLELNINCQEDKTPAECFPSFLERLRQPEIALAILQEYPVLARQLTLRIDQWATISLELLQRFSADWPAIRVTFTPQANPGRLVQVTSAAGDRHRGGRAVQILVFSSGFKLVYKPKSLAVDLNFQQLLAWLNTHGSQPPLRILNVMDRGAYGWEEFVTAQSCASLEEVTRFYQRQGSYLALLYVLEATDFHFGNIIAAGEHPVLIDLEALFHARFGGQSSQPVDRQTTDLLAHSVLRVGLLPARFASGPESDSPDMSGLGAAGGQMTPQALPYWEAVGTDEMRLDRKQMTLAPGQNQPKLNETDVNLLDYTPAILTGFTSMYRLLVTLRDELSAPSGPLAHFANDEVRVVVRPTRIYMRLLQESFHPDVLRCALERDRLFDHLWIGVDQFPYLSQIISSERQDLSNGDVPMFTARPGSRHIWNSAQACLTDFLDEPGLTLAQRRLQQLSETDLTRQVMFILASLAASAGEVKGIQPDT